MSRSFFFVLICLYLVSCKKTNGSTGASSGGTNSSSQAAKYDAWLLCLKGQGWIDAQVVFFASPQPLSFDLGNPARVMADSVFINNKRFDYSSDTTYDCSDSTLIFPPAAWRVYVHGSFNSFNYTNSNPFPSCNLSYLPVNVYRSQNLTLSLNGISNWNQLVVEIDDHTGNSITQYVYYGSQNIVFPKDSLAKLDTGNVDFFIDAFNLNTQMFSGKKILFANDNQFYKSMHLLP